MFRSPFTELSVEPAQLQLLQHSRGNAPGDCHRARAVAEPSVMPFLRSPPDRRSCFTTFAHPMLDSGNMLRAQNLRYAAPQSLSADNSDYVRYRDNMLGHNSFGAMHGAKPVVVDVLKRFPATPGGGARVGELIRMLDAVLRH